MYYGGSWIEQIFDAKQVLKRGLVRRKLSSVLKIVGSLDVLEAEVRQRGFHMIITRNQVLILCDPDGHFRLVC